jgi:iron complex transport system substrate-binding protein
MRLFAIILTFLAAAPCWAALEAGVPTQQRETPTITRVFGSAPPMTLLSYVLNGDTLIAVNAPLNNSANNAEPRFLSPRFLRLPVLGGWHGDKQPNLEEILLAHPELIVIWDTPLLSDRVAADLQKINIPAIRVNIDRTDSYPEAFRILGATLGARERGEQLAAYAEKELRQLQAFTAAIPPEKRVRVYYAEGPDGLRTECEHSFHAEPIAFAGGENVQHCTQSTVMGMVAVNFEQILQYDPEVMIAQEQEFMRAVSRDDKWRNLSAVKKKRVYLVPRTPFNWLDRPPSLMRILGAHWLASILYPDQYPYDLRAKTAAFFTLFFGVTLSDEEMTRYFPAPSAP